VPTLKGYSKGDFRADATAGLTTAVLLVPQGMAYALLAGLPPIHGLYAALVPPAIYALFGTSRQLSVGPVAMDSLLVAASVGTLAEVGTANYLAAAITLAMLVGLIQILMGLLRVGFVVNFLSAPVLSGFTSAAAVLIGLSQAKYFFGIDVAASPTVVALVPQLVQELPALSGATLAVGFGSLAVIVLLKWGAPRFPAALVAVAVGSFAVVFLGLQDRVGVVGPVPAGLPRLSFPLVNLALVVELLPMAVTIALVAFMESISVGEVYAKKNKYHLRPDRELVALGLANSAGSLVGGYPVAGGFSRTSVNAQAGARTSVASWVAASGVALALLFLTPLLAHIPHAALAAIILAAVAGLIDYRAVRHLYKVEKRDLALLILTFFATLGFGILPGILIGVSASVLWFVVRTTHPHVAVLGRVPGTRIFRNVARYQNLVTYQGVLIVRMDSQFYFGNIAYLREKLEELEHAMNEPLATVIMDFSSINNIDSSAEAALLEMLDEYRARGVALYLAGVKGPVRDVLESSGLAAKLGQAGRCLSLDEALSLIRAEPRENDEHRVSKWPEGDGAQASGSSARL
jgi:sulfate permease, SulP family